MLVLHEMPVHRKLFRALPFVWPEQTQAKNLAAACLMKYLLWGRGFHLLPPMVVGERFLEISVVDRRAMCLQSFCMAVVSLKP